MLPQPEVVAMAFKVMTWNIENFSKTDPEFNKRYTEKLEHVAKTIKELKPDVVALQEVLDEAALNELAKRTELDAIVSEPDSRGNRVAALVRKATLVGHAQPVKAYRLPKGAVVQAFDKDEHVIHSPELSRPPLTFTVKQGGKQITLFNAHLKSKLQTFPNGLFSTKDEDLRAGVAFFDLGRRAAESATLREQVTALLKADVKARVIVLGDLNDGPHAATTEILYGPPGSQLRVPEDATKQSSGFTRGDDGDAQRLFNIVKLVSEAERWSRITNNVPELIDHILCSQELMPRAGELRRVPEVDILNEGIKSIGEQPRKDSGIPDHAPIVATFEV
jgi:endonuclease/exonuclease/phosphatase family metal-dependent hydrolase